MAEPANEDLVSVCTKDNGQVDCQDRKQSVGFGVYKENTLSNFVYGRGQRLLERYTGKHQKIHSQ